MKMYRDANGEFHRTQLEAKATKLTFSPIDVPTDSHGLCEFLNLMNPPPEYLPQIRDIMSRSPGAPVELTEPTEASWAGDDVHIDNEIQADLEPYREGEPSRVFAKSRDPAAIFNCTFCGKQNRNLARKA